jgi:sugar-specific transcriptional regulator TrmB
MKFQDLRRIGLTIGEIKIYDALLELGECTKTSLAKKSGISPSNIYDVTNRLVEKGIISKVEKNGVSHFSPANPNHILNFLEDKERTIKEEKDFVNQILPSLLLKFSESREKVNVEVFQNWKGMKTIFEDLIEKCTSVCSVFGASKGDDDKQADRFFLKYSRLRAQKNIITNIIFNDELRTRKDRIEFFMKSKNYNIRFLQQTTPAEIMMYNNITCIIILTKEPLIIRITSTELNQSFTSYFNLMWKLASD